MLEINTNMRLTPDRHGTDSRKFYSLVFPMLHLDRQAVTTYFGLLNTTSRLTGFIYKQQRCVRIGLSTSLLGIFQYPSTFT